MSPVRAIPTSRAYWELKAEQVLNRVFEPEQPIEVEVCETPLTPAAGALRASQESAPPENPSSQPADPTTRTNTRLSTTSLPRWIQQLGRQPSLLLAGSSVSLMLLAALSLLILGSWNHSQQAIRQERNLLLMERLRGMGPGNPAATVDPSAATSTEMPAEDGDLPPPPPNEPWVEELSSLPPSNAPAADVLRVPVNDRIGSPAPATTGGTSTGSSGANQASASNAPQLVGIVQVPGQSGSAIFQIGGSSTSAAVGESIGSSGWRLRSASGDSAIIEKGGEQKRVSISSGF